MPSVETNRAVWGDDYAWPQRGDEWSAPWGSATTQWHCVILPRIRTFLPANTVLEIAPGYGRWTQFLQPEAQHLIVVDLSESCIEACKSRFAEATNISYHVNDGKSLAMVVEESVDFAFSFDSLVHADLDVLRAYLAELSKRLSPDGVAFLHHSNIGVYARRWAIQNHLPRNLWRVLGPIRFAGNSHDRDFTVTAAGVERVCRDVGLVCIAQETLNWCHTLRIDGFSTLTRAGSKWARPNQVWANSRFMRQAADARRINHLYSFRTRSTAGRSIGASRRLPT
jgi:SAM-dependent methyltransferase